MDELFFYIFFFILLIGYLIAYESYNILKRNLKIKITPTSKTASCSQGKAEFQGYAWPANKTFGPLSKKPVALFIIEGVFKNSKSYENNLKFKFSSEKPFYLIDETGNIELNPNSEFNFAGQNRIVKNWPELTDEEKIFIKDYLLTKTNYNLTKSFLARLQITEISIDQGSPIYAQGFFKSFDSFSESKINLDSGLDAFMFDSRKKFLFQYIINDKKKLPSIDSPWAKATQNFSSKSVTHVTKEKLWHRCHGQLTALKDEPIILANTWETQLLKQEKNTISRIIFGGFIFTIAFLALVYYFLNL